MDSSSYLTVWYSNSNIGKHFQNFPKLQKWGCISDMFQLLFLLQRQINNFMSWVRLQTRWFLKGWFTPVTLLGVAQICRLSFVFMCVQYQQCTVQYVCCTLGVLTYQMGKWFDKMSTQIKVTAHLNCALTLFFFKEKCDVIQSITLLTEVNKCCQ